MTEPRGRAARWNTALLLVPGAAAMFGGAVAWAANTAPAPSGSPTTPQQQAVVSPALDPAAGAHVALVQRQLEDELAARRRNAARLEHRLASLRAMTARLNHGSGSGPGDGSIGQVAVPAPVPVQVQAPAPAPPPPPPPPPVNANTGASGHP